MKQAMKSENLELTTSNLRADMSEAAYRALEHLGSTDISMLLDNARKFDLIRRRELVENKECFEFGKAFHVALLEPELLFDAVAVANKINLGLREVAWRNNFVVAPCRGKTAKVFIEMVADNPDKDVLIEPEFEQVQFFQQHPEKIVVTTVEFNKIEKLVEKAKRVPGFENYLANGKKEQSFFGEIDGVPVKGRMDVMFQTKEGFYIFDPKHTGMEATAHTFSQMSASHNYYVQEWLYTEILRQNDIPVRDYLFLVVSQLDHSGAGYYKHDYVAMERAEELVHKAIQKFKACTDSGLWGEGKFNWETKEFELVSEVTLPSYIFYKYE